MVSKAPRFKPSSLNCTLDTLALSVADAVTVSADPATMPPLIGAEIETVGRVLSTTILSGAEVTVFPSVSFPIAVSTCGPLGAAIVFHAIENGGAVTGGPRLT